MKSHPPIYTNATKESVLLLFNQDISSAHIAQVLHISQETVFAILDSTSNQRKGQEAELGSYENLPTLVSLVMDYKPESATLEINMQVKGTSPTDVECLTGMLARLVNQATNPVVT